MNGRVAPVLSLGNAFVWIVWFVVQILESPIPTTASVWVRGLSSLYAASPRNRRSIRSRPISGASVAMSGP